MNCSFCANSSYHCDGEGTKNDPVQFRDDTNEELNLASNPATNENTAPEEDKVDDIVEQNVYCEGTEKDITSAPFKTVADVRS